MIISVIENFVLFQNKKYLMRIGLRMPEINWNYSLSHDVTVFSRYVCCHSMGRSGLWVAPLERCRDASE